MALRRWKPFLGAFAQIDDTIEAAAGVSREAFRHVRDRLVETLCAAADDGAAEEACTLLDAAMAESLLTLRDAVPASAAKGALATEEVVAALGALMTRHESARVRGLARDVALRWRAGVEAEFAMARAALKVLDGVGASARPVVSPPIDAKKQVQIVTKKQAEIIPEKKKQACPKKPATAPIVGRYDAKTAKAPDPKKCVPKNANPVLGCGRVMAPAYAKASTEIAAPPPPPKKALPNKIDGAGEKGRTVAVPPSIAEEKKMESAKRKLHERYQEIEDAKRRRTVRVIEAPPQKTKSQMQMQGRTTQPAVRAPGRASCAGEIRHFGTSSHQRRV